MELRGIRKERTNSSSDMRKSWLTLKGMGNAHKRKKKNQNSIFLQIEEIKRKTQGKQEMEKNIEGVIVIRGRPNLKNLRAKSEALKESRKREIGEM